MPWNSLQVTPKVINVVNEKHSCLLFQHHFQLFLLYIPKRYWQFFKKCNASVRSILTFQHGLPLIFSLVKELFEEVTSPSHSVVFLYFFALITEEGFLISLAVLHSDGCIFPFRLCLEKGMANHFSILALRTPWTVWKGKKIGHWKMNSPGQ